MARLQKMRDKYGKFISIIIGLSLLYFIAPIDDLMNLFSAPQNVGEIAGRGVTYEDFLQEVDKYTTISEIATGSTVQNEQSQQQVRNMAWQSYLDEYMFIKNAKAAGIKVGHAESVEILRAGLPEEQIVELSTTEDSRLQLYWDYVQTSIASQQYHSKYNTLFGASSVENNLSKAEIIAQNNTLYDFDVVSIPYLFAPDSTISVSNAEIKSYYKNHKKEFKQNASRDVEYVVFEVTPSASDRAATAEKMAVAHADFAKISNARAFLLRNSDRSLSDYWYKKGELASINADVDAFAFSSAKGVSPIYEKDNTFYAAKVLESKMIPDSVYVKHILLQGPTAQAEADSLLAVVTKKPGSFSTVATLHSADQGSQADGEIGNIGWMTQTYIIPGFEDCFTAQLNKPFVLNTQYGSHVVVVTKKTTPVLKKRVAILEKNVVASKETFNAKYAEANRFASIANGSAQGYLKAVDSLGVYSHKLNGVVEGNSNYGSVDQAREVTRWIYDHKAGKASSIITVNNNFFFVVAVNAIHKDGYQPLSEVSAQIRQNIYAQKRREVTAQSVAAKIQGMTTLDQVAAEYGSVVLNRKGISGVNASSTEPALLGALSKAVQGEISAPVAGVRSTYVFVLTGKEEGAFFTEQDADNYSSQKAMYNTQMLMPVMMEAADVKDNRARYY